MVCSAEGMAPGAAEIGERHFETATESGIELMNLAGKSMRRQPFGQGIGVQESAIDFFRRGAEHAMETD